MSVDKAVQTLAGLDREGWQVFDAPTLERVIPGRAGGALTTELMARGFLSEVGEGLWIYLPSRCEGRLERLALALRAGDACYMSLHSALSEYSIIPQMAIGCLTVMTTGHGGDVSTDWGTISFTHTDRTPTEIRARTVHWGPPLRRAKPRLALEDFRHACTDHAAVQLDYGELLEIEHEMHLPPPTEEEERQLDYWLALGRQLASPWRSDCDGGRIAR